MAQQEEGLDRFRKNINETNKLFATLENRIIKLQQNGTSAQEIIKALNGEMEKATAKFRATTSQIRVNQNALDKNSKAYKESTDVIKNLNGGMNRLESVFKRATKTTDTFGQAFRKQFSAESLGKSLGSLLKYVGGYKLFTGALELVKNTTVAAAKANIEYESELAKLEAVTGASANEMDMLSENILQVAGNTKFTSSEIVKLQTSLGKLGFSTEEIIASTQAIANVAQALGEDAAPVAERVGQILNQFNLTAAESVQVGDVLVSTINNSALSFESFGTAIQYVGPLAAELGTSFTELSAAMAVLADSGFTASRIGTGLRGILTELGTTGQDLVSIVEDLADEEISFADAVDLVGKRAAAQLLTLVDNVEVLEEAEERYEETGAAIIASAKQIDTFKGNTELLNSAWNAFLINLGEFYNRAGLVRTALRILDSEAADTAEGLKDIANVAPEVVGAGFDKAISDFQRLRKEGKSYEEALVEAQKQGALLIGEESLLKTSTKYNQLLKSRARLKEQEAKGFDRTTALATNQFQIDQLRAKEATRILAALGEEIEGQILNTELQDQRNTIAAEYKDLYDGLLQTSVALNAEGEKGNLKESQRLTFNKEVEEEIEKIKQRKSRIENGELRSLELKKKAGIELSDDEKLRLNVLSAQVDALDTQIGKLRNIEVLSGKEKKVAKEKSDTFNDEIKNLEKSIALQKAILEQRLETNEAIRIGLEADLERAKTDEERFEIQERIRELESRSLQSQEDAYNTIVGLVAQYQAKLQEAGLSTEETAKATKKLESILLGVSGLDVGFEELADSAKRFAKDFKKTFGEQLKDGKELTESQQEFVNTYIDGLIEKFGITSPEQQEALRGILSSLLFVGDGDGLDKDIKKFTEDILGELTDVLDEYNDTALENTKNRVNAELDELRRKSQIEQDILKAQLDNQLITESQFRTKSLELQKAQLAKENTLNKKVFDAEKAADLNSVKAETLEALTSSILNNYEKYDVVSASGVLAILSTLAVGAAGIAKANAINSRKFYPKTFAEGGMVNGPSHAEGGVPFTVQGQGGYEMEGGEFIVNKRSTSKYRGLLEKINNSYSINPSQRKFATGGMVAARQDESVDYLKAIAEATTQSAIQGSKPVRAFVSAKDLRTNENERRLRDRNDRI